jgi:signal transduction histidine kinase
VPDFITFRLIVAIAIHLGVFITLIILAKRSSLVSKREKAYRDEMAAREKVEQELKRHRDQLDEKINERTKELQKAIKKAEEANKVKSEFLANMNHEIRTPLNIITGFAYILKEKMLEDREGLEAIENIEKASENLKNLIGDILDISKIEAGKMNINPDFLNIHDLIYEVHESYMPKAREKSLLFNINIDKTVPLVIKLDGTRLRQIIYNLIGNAFKFTDEGEIKISVYGSVTNDKSKVDITVSVKDTGIGISRAQKDKMFEPFIQHDGQSTRKYGGTGLGLAICRKLTEMMNGAISVESEEGKGSVFFIVFKDVEIGSYEGRENFDLASNEKIDVSKLRGLKILVAEDNDLNKAVMLKFLSECNAKIFDVSNGRDAVSVAKKVLPDIILMDILMPELDGLSATKLLRNDPELKRTPIIAVTALSRDNRSFDMERVFDTVIEKPFSKDQLFSNMLLFAKGDHEIEQ